VVEKAFPGSIAFNGRETGDDVVEVQVKETSSSNLLKHLHLANANPKWWLSVAEAKTGGAYLKEDAKLSKKAAEALANGVDVKGSQAGDIQSAYAAQQMTSNLVIERMGK